VNASGSVNIRRFARAPHPPAAPGCGILTYLGTVLILFPDERDVFVDNGKCGVTNEPFNVVDGTHDFDLGLPGDYVPPSMTVAVTAETNALRPLTLVFIPAESR
jgi:hypothetical protein